MRGIIMKAIKMKGMLHPHSFFIEDEEGHKYVANLGDLEESEKLLGGDEQTQYLDLGDEVEFEIFNDRAVHIKKIG